MILKQLAWTAVLTCFQYLDWTCWSKHYFKLTIWHTYQTNITTLYLFHSRFISCQIIVFKSCSISHRLQTALKRALCLPEYSAIPEQKYLIFKQVFNYIHLPVCCIQKALLSGIKWGLLYRTEGGRLTTVTPHTSSCVRRTRDRRRNPPLPHRSQAVNRWVWRP